MHLAAILKHKGTEVVTTTEHATVAEVVRLLARRRIGAAPVLGPDGAVAGILSERDVMHALAAMGAEALERPAADLMTRDVHTASPATTVDEAVRAMTEGRFRHMPVLEAGRLVGLVSIGDVVKARMMEQEAEVDGLKAYVTGAGAAEAAPGLP
jgi:CBS domain-containing protein